MTSLFRPRSLASALTLGLTAFGCFAAVASVSGCKDEKTTNPDEASTTGGAEPEPEPEPAAIPEQDPDPAEIAAYYDRYLKGDYAGVMADAGSLVSSMSADTQIRARTLASSLMALAAAEETPETGKAAAEQAVVDGDRLADPEVQQLAHIAHGAYLVRVHEAATAQTELEAAIGLSATYASLGQLMLAEAHLNQAFGVGEDDQKILNPAKLDDARAAYQAVLTSDSALLQGQAHEGLAAVADYKGEKPAVCEHAQQAEDLYAANGATDYLREVPSLLAGEAKCKGFKKAE